MDNNIANDFNKLMNKRKNLKSELNVETKITNLHDLKKFVNRLKRGNKKDDSLKDIVVEVENTTSKQNDENNKNKIEKVVIPQKDNKAIINETLIEGFNMIKNHMEYMRKLSEYNTTDGFGGYLPAKVPDITTKKTWLDTFLEKNLGGKREGLSIVWYFNSGKYKLDPWTLEISKID